MTAGLAALFDDVTAIARGAASKVGDVSAAAGRASVNATAIVVDDTAVTPQYVTGVTADRELPIVGRIALGSLRNKLLMLLPLVLLLSQFLPALLTPILMIGAAYLCYEGAEKVWERFYRHEHHDEQGADAFDEKNLVTGAIRTDLVLSAEIMMIALSNVTGHPFFTRGAILAVVAVIMTGIVYGSVALIVKMDDAGLLLARLNNRPLAAVGRALAGGMTKLLSTLTAIGTVAMLWVGGRILIEGSHELGLLLPQEIVESATHAAHTATGWFGGIAGFLISLSAEVAGGMAVGSVLILLIAAGVRYYRTVRSGLTRPPAGQ